MKLGTIELSKEKNKLDSQDNTFFRDVLMIAKKFKIELLEISNVRSPTGISLKIITDQHRFIVPLYRHIKDFIHYNGIFILDTSTIDEFELNPRDGFFIEIASDEDFALKIYYSTDRNSEFADEKYI
jgi:hypothetical protein